MCDRINVQNNPVNLVDPWGLLVLGGGLSGSAAALVGVDGSVAVVHAIGNDTGVLVNVGGSAGAQAALGVGFTGIVAPFADSVNDLKGTTFDYQLRLGFQLTISIPLKAIPARTGWLCAGPLRPKPIIKHPMFITASRILKRH